MNEDARQSSDLACTHTQRAVLVLPHSNLSQSTDSCGECRLEGWLPQRNSSLVCCHSMPSISSLQSIEQEQMMPRQEQASLQSKIKVISLPEIHQVADPNRHYQTDLRRVCCRNWNCLWLLEVPFVWTLSMMAQSSPLFPCVSLWHQNKNIKILVSLCVPLLKLKLIQQ